MKTLKTISTAVMLITGIITALAGAIETIIKLVEKVAPAPVNLPSPMLEKSFRGIEEIIPPVDPGFVFPYLGATELILLGAVLIILSFYLNRTK